MPCIWFESAKTLAASPPNPAKTVPTHSTFKTSSRINLARRNPIGALCRNRRIKWTCRRAQTAGQLSRLGFGPRQRAPRIGQPGNINTKPSFSYAYRRHSATDFGVPIITSCCRSVATSWNTSEAPMIFSYLRNNDSVAAPAGA
jgi:hypothetical protein